MTDAASDHVAELLDKQAIAEALYRYCVAVDRMDESVWWSVWDRNAEAHYEGIFDGSAADLMEWIFETHRSCDGTSHQVANVVVQCDGSTATSESYVTAFLRAGANDIVARGRYRDAWSKHAGAWRIDERIYRDNLVQVTPVIMTGL